MVASDETLYQAHVKNLRAVDTALERILLELNSALARGDEKTSDALTKTSMLLLGGWAENRLRKLMYEPQGFLPAERKRIAEESSQFDAWKSALEIGFRKRHGIPKADLKTVLPITARAHYLALLGTLESDLRPIIEVRNKLAHGQWSRTLTNGNDDFSPEMMARIAAENAHTIKCKKRILTYLAQLIHDLVAGRDAFVRDFDNHFKNLEQAKYDIKRRSFGDWKKSMQAKFLRGKAKRIK
jgi:hypothetical protein